MSEHRPAHDIRQGATPPREWNGGIGLAAMRTKRHFEKRSVCARRKISKATSVKEKAAEARSPMV
ncbi:hypothetical protein RR46_03159 [Papilio xuthus]|uniref:Uncharacterized protein n=1 Tax=Papilio xuthus TaxID=66420 RepID=A0A194Q766_PAPXU|nr:hypothetical protein RR46_03159 [Papilio xuthus]